jgi:hypothetical protein
LAVLLNFFLSAPDKRCTVFTSTGFLNMVDQWPDHRQQAELKIYSLHMQPQLHERPWNLQEVGLAKHRRNIKKNAEPVSSYFALIACLTNNYINNKSPNHREKRLLRMGATWHNSSYQ